MKFLKGSFLVEHESHARVIIVKVFTGLCKKHGLCVLINNNTFTKFSYFTHKQSLKYLHTYKV